MKKLLALVSVVGMVAMWSGCGITDPVSAPTVALDPIGAIEVGAYKNVTGKVEADSTISVFDCSIATSAGDPVPSSQIEVSKPSGIIGEKSFTFNSANPIKITVKSGPAGSYKLKITAEAGGASADFSFDFTVTGSSGTPVETETVTIGSLDNPTLGSSIDLDNGTVMLAAAAKAAGSGVDIVGTYSSDLSAFRIFSPVYAKESSGITAFANWVSPNDTKFKKVSVDFTSITTKEQIASLYSSTTSAELSDANAAVGDVFVVDTDEGFALIEITSFTSTTTGTANIKYGN